MFYFGTKFELARVLIHHPCNQFQARYGITILAESTCKNGITHEYTKVLLGRPRRNMEWHCIATARWKQWPFLQAPMPLHRRVGVVTRFLRSDGLYLRVLVQQNIARCQRKLGHPLSNTPNHFPSHAHGDKQAQMSFRILSRSPMPQAWP